MNEHFVIDECLLEELDKVMNEFVAQDTSATYIPLQDVSQFPISTISNFHNGQKFSAEVVGVIAFEDLRDTIQDVGNEELLKYWNRVHADNGRVSFFEHKESTWLFLKIVPQFARDLKVVK